MKIVSTIGLMLICLAGCGDGGGGSADVNAPVLSETVPPGETISPGEPDGNQDNGSSESSPKTQPRVPPVLQGRETARDADGRIVYLPAKPDGLMVPPSRSCTRDEDQLRPPRPGLRARRLDERHLLVTINFKSIPGRCTPDYVRLTFDVHRDPLPPSSQMLPIGDTRTPIEVELPERVSDADIVRATSVMTRTGRSSETASVLVAGGA